MKTNSNFNVIQTLLNWLNQGEEVCLISVIHTWGSSPMPAGTLMAYCTTQGTVGSLSGGCIEEDLLIKIASGELKQSLHPASQTLKLIYGNNPDEQQRFQLPCGGELHLLLEFLQPTQSTLQHFNQLRERLFSRCKVARCISLDYASLKVVEENVVLGITASENVVEHGMGPGYQMLLIGASEVARCVAELAIPLDFKVSVWDHRKEIIKNWHVDGVEVYSGSPEKLISQYFSDVNNAIIALAHDPRVDDIALIDALNTDAFYIGAIGSKQNCARRNERLLKVIEDPKALEKLHAPVGIYIGSKTPYEIAISILAEVIQERRKLEMVTGIS